MKETNKMKKLMIACAAVAMAACAQAAAVTWSSGTFSNGFAGPDDKTLKNSTAYTMTMTIFADAECTTKIGSQTDSQANGGGSYGDTYSGLEKNTTYYMKAVIENDEWIRETDVCSFTTPDVDNPLSTSFISGSGFSTTGNKWGEWQAVPEPTSGLLLLLGMAGLALKRKRA